MNISETSEPLILTIIHVQRETLNRIRYTWSGSFLAAADTLRAKLFIINPNEEAHNFVLGKLQISIEILDFLLYEVTAQSSKILVLARTNKALKCGRKIIVYYFNNVNLSEKCHCLIELPAMLDSLTYGRHKFEIIVVPYLSKQLHFLKIQVKYAYKHKQYKRNHLKT